jgi:hypothetical protein
MSRPAGDPLVRKYGIGGCVTKETKERITRDAAKWGVSIGNFIGGILEKWARETKEKEGELVKYLPYRPDQLPKVIRPHVVRDGPLGKEKREEVILRREGARQGGKFGKQAGSVASRVLRKSILIEGVKYE